VAWGACEVIEWWWWWKRVGEGCERGERDLHCRVAQTRMNHKMATLLASRLLSRAANLVRATSSMASIFKLVSVSAANCVQNWGCFCEVVREKAN